MKTQTICTTDCVHCTSYYNCESEMKLEETTRDFWVDEENKSDEYDSMQMEREALEREIAEDCKEEAPYSVAVDGAVVLIRIYYVGDRIPMADITTAFGFKKTIEWCCPTDRKEFEDGINGYTIYKDERIEDGDYKNDTKIKNNTELKVGSKVRCIATCDGNQHIKGQIGKVLGFDDKSILVEFNVHVCGHDGHRFCGLSFLKSIYDKFPVGKDFHCWYFPVISDVQLLEVAK